MQTTRLLRNKLSKEQAMARLAHETAPRTTLSFYRYVQIDEPEKFRDAVYAALDSIGVLGRIYVAHEGVNAQISVPTPHLGLLTQTLNSFEALRDMYLNIAVEQAQSFYKLKIKIRRQIVADGLPEGAYDLQNIGTHLNAAQFNQALQDPNAIVVDMRNVYESRVGHFEQALTPNVQLFRDELKQVAAELADKKEKKILLYCTGGIRCEKTSAFLKHQGFQDVNQLRGGIITYAREVRELGLESKFKGKNFTFDERLGERITPDILTTCDTCGTPNDDYTNCAFKPCNKLFVQCSSCKTALDNTCSEGCHESLLAARLNPASGAHQSTRFATQTPQSQTQPPR